MNYKILYFSLIWIFVIYLLPIMHAEQLSSFKTISGFNKHYIGKVISETNTITIQIQSESDSLKPKRSIKLGKVLGFAVIGFLSGLFIGAETFHGELSGVVFHVKPAFIGAAIGAGLGVVVSLLEPEKPKKKK